MLRAPKTDVLTNLKAADTRPAVSQETKMSDVVHEHFLIKIVRNQDFLEEVLFLGVDGSLGAFASASKSGDMTTSNRLELKAVRNDELDAFLMSQLNDRHDLFAFTDFANVCGDGFGNPAVFHFNWRCKGCGKSADTWRSDIGENQSCPHCSHGVKTENTTISWVGPDDPFLISLWERLPAHKRRTV